MSKKSRERRAAYVRSTGAEPAAVSAENRLTSGDVRREASERLSGADILSTNSERLRLGGAEVVRSGSKSGRRAAEQAEKRKRRYILCVVLISVALSVFVLARMYININEQLALELQVSEVDISAVGDGEYTAAYESSHMSATVRVGIASGRITGAELVAFTGIDNARAAEVLRQVVYYQRLNIPEGDVGTQPTDMIVLKAVEKALMTANDYTPEAGEAAA